MERSMFLMPSGRWLDMRFPDAAQIHWPDWAELGAKYCVLSGRAPGGMFSFAQLACLAADRLPSEFCCCSLIFGLSGVILRDFQVLGGLNADGAVRCAEPILKALCAATRDPITMRPAWPREVVAITEAVSKAARHDLLMLAFHRPDQSCLASAVEYPRPQTIPLIKSWPWTRAADEWLRRARRAGLTWEG